MADDLKNLPLREKFTTAERLTRELIEHLEQGFLPKLQRLRKVTRQSEEANVTDATVRTQCKQALNSDDFTEELFTKLQTYLKSIDDEMKPMVFGE